MYKHLEGLDFGAVKASDVTILIGGNVPKACVSWDVREGLDNQPLAVKTSFGWTLFGSAEVKKANCLPSLRKV